VLIGAVSLVPTVASGYLAANSLDVGAAALGDLERHEHNAWYVMGLVVVALFWKGWYRGAPPPSQHKPYAALLLVVVLLVAYSALVGGEMVYLHGVGVR
jgi:uncharacterized membrane protein